MTTIVLASASPARRALLEGAGLEIIAEPASIDEAAVKDSMREERASAVTCATVLAETKARRIARRHPGRLVIGADQLLDCAGVWFDKPPDIAHARAQLQALRGRSHELVTACCVVRDDAVLWHTVDRPRLTMRVFSDPFLDDYLHQAGSGILGSVGAYQLEGIGVQLFQRIEGDYFSILGLPLLSLLDFLRGHGALAS